MKQICHKIVGEVKIEVEKKIIEKMAGLGEKIIQATKETKLERADFTLQLLMFVTAERNIVYNFLSSQFWSAVVPLI